MPTDRSRPDACPGALQLHQAADGALARVRLPGGALSGPQLRCLALASRELGSGLLELTSRANLQLRALRADTSDELADRLGAAGLLPSRTHERARNIIASPLSGLDDRGLADVRPLVAVLDEALCARPALAALSGRFLFALDDGRGDVIPHLRPDLGLRALSTETYELHLSGHPHTPHIPASHAVTALLTAAEAFLTERTTHASEAWRLTDLPTALPAILAALPIASPPPAPTDSAAPTSSPATGATAPAPEPEVAFAAPCAPEPVALVMPAATTARTALTGTRAPSDAPAGAPVSVGAGVRGALVGVVGRRDGVVAVGVGAALGRMTAEQALVLARFERVVVTPWRGVVVPGVPEGEAGALLAELGAAGFVVDGGSALAGVTACTGRPGCAKSLGDVQGDAHGFVAVSGGAVHLSGCDRRCGRPSGGFVDVVATAGGYRVGGGAVLSRREEIEAAVTVAREGL